MKPIAPKPGTKYFLYRHRRGQVQTSASPIIATRKIGLRACVCAQHDNALVGCSVEAPASESAWCAPNSYSLGLNIREGRIRLRNVVSTVTGPVLWAGSFAVYPGYIACPNRLDGRPASCSNHEYTFVGRIPTAAGSRSGSPSRSVRQGRVHQAGIKLRIVNWPSMS